MRLAPTSPGVYRMLNAADDVLYVGKAKNVKKRLTSYARVNAPQPARILRMIAATVNVEIVSTTTETEALLLEANLIKQLRPRFNVQLRDDKSFPYILITGDHWAPQILKHRGAQTRPGRYFGPFASAGAVNRTITALQRAFLIRSCTDAFFESRTRPCLLYQIRRCSGPCTREIDFPGYTELVREATDFLSGRSHAVKQELAAEMEKASGELEFETAALYRDRLAALSAIQSQQGINPRTRGRGRRVRDPSGRRLFLRRGVLLPHRAELGQSRLFSARGKIIHAGRSAGRVPHAILRRQAAAEARAALA